MALSLITITRATSAQFAAQNPILATNVQGYETDTGKWKAGNAVNQWLDLPYAVDYNIVTPSPVIPNVETLVPPVTDTGGVLTETSAIAYSPITDPASVSFVVPASGGVIAHLDIHLRSTVAGTESRAGLWVREGPVLGSGTLVRTIETIVANATDQWVKAGGSLLIMLTPSATYNIQPCVASETAGVIVAASHHILTVAPVAKGALT